MLGSERCHRLGQPEQEPAEAGCGTHREFFKQQQNEAGQNGLCNSSSSLSSPEAGVPGSEQAYPTTSHCWPSSAPGRSCNISPQCWRGDLSLCRVPADKVRRHAKTQQRVSVQRGRLSSTQRRLPLGQAEIQVHPKLTAASNTAPECPLPSLPARHCPRMGRCPKGRDTVILALQVPLAVPPKSLPSTATKRGKFDICREISPRSVLIISQVEADFCSMIQAVGSRECKHRGCFPGKWGLSLPKRSRAGGKSVAGT